MFTSSLGKLSIQSEGRSGSLKSWPANHILSSKLNTVQTFTAVNILHYANFPRSHANPARSFLCTQHVEPLYHIALRVHSMLNHFTTSRYSMTQYEQRTKVNLKVCQRGSFSDTAKPKSVSGSRTLKILPEDVLLFGTSRLKAARNQI
ncbi:hypothetical protein BaRGS_00015703 [Batillaria attramentaria]|uniref:Uncharacterized protein n=1 Tax=Batillaria attramentaria TaxID=370345 RepID=A0ABD0L102_9CAEN